MIGKINFMLKTSQCSIFTKIILTIYLISFSLISCLAKVNNKPDFISGDFDYYVFAQSWYPTFCISGPKNECKNLTEYMKKNLSPHGLWPNKNSAKKFSNHPSYCINSNGCEIDKSCDVDWRTIQNSTLNNIQTMMPTNLMQHEWRKHGTCSTYNQDHYFQNILSLQTKYKTPDIIAVNIGKNLSYKEILEALGGKDRVNILCKTINNQQYLEQAHYFLDKNLKEISKRYDQTNCDKNAKINIKRNNE
jgi:ribonuclease T2